MGLYLWLPAEASALSPCPGGGSGDSSSNNMQGDVPPENIFSAENWEYAKNGHSTASSCWTKSNAAAGFMNTRCVLSLATDNHTSKVKAIGLHGLVCSKKGAPGFWKQLSAKRTLELTPGFSVLDLLQLKLRCRPGLSNVNFFPT